MKLLIFSPFYPPHIGGLETHSAEFNRFAGEAGHRVTVFTPRLPPNSEPEENIGSVHIIRYPAFELIHNYPVPIFWKGEFWREWREIQNASFNILISRTRFFFSSLMAWRLARKKRLPWLHIEHGSAFVHFETGWKRTLAKFYDLILGKLVLQRADQLVANSKASKIFVEKLSKRKDCVVIYRGVDTALITSAKPNQEVEVRWKDFTKVIYIGRLIIGKGVHDLIKAFAILSPISAVLLIVGSGPERERLGQLVEKYQLQDRVVLFGARPLPEALSLLAASDIAVNPSYNEGIPTSVIEAALMKKAIVATNVGGTGEIISGESDGFLIPLKHPDILAEKLKLLLDDPNLRRTMGENASLSVEDRFSWKKAIEQYRRVFETISKF